MMSFVAGSLCHMAIVTVFTPLVLGSIFCRSVLYVSWESMAAGDTFCGGSHGFGDDEGDPQIFDEAKQISIFGLRVAKFRRGSKGP